MRDVLVLAQRWRGSFATRHRLMPAARGTCWRAALSVATCGSLSHPSSVSTTSASSGYASSSVSTGFLGLNLSAPTSAVRPRHILTRGRDIGTDRAREGPRSARRQHARSL
jgi:hypothetical protein